MDAPIFYAPPESIVENIVKLDSKESHHAAKVMRLALGSPVIVVDGVGTAWRGAIAKLTGRKGVEIRLHSEIRNFGEPTALITLASGLSTGYKFDTVVEKGTELGVKRFVPVITSKSKVKFDDSKRAKSRKTRLEKVALAAIKQCRRSYRPEISLPINLSGFLDETDPESLNLIFHPCESARPLAEMLGESARRISILIGPEAGFSPDEFEAAQQVGYVAVSMGPRILRTETAGPAAVALVMNALGELR